MHIKLFMHFYSTYLRYIKLVNLTILLYYKNNPLTSNVIIEYLYRLIYY